MQHVISHPTVYARPQNPSAFSSEEMEGRMECAWVKWERGALCVSKGVEE